MDPAPLARARAVQAHRRASLLIAATLALVWPGASWGWGFIGHRLITRVAVSILPPEVRDLLAGLDHELSGATIRPDHESQASRDEAIKHYINCEILDAGYAPILDSLAKTQVSQQAPGRRQRKRRRGRRGPTGWDEATGLRSTQTPPGAAPAASSDDPEPTPSRRQEEIRYFAPRLPYPAEAIDGFYRLIPPDRAAFETRIIPARRRALGLVPFQLADYYPRLVAALRQGDRIGLVEAIGRISHYVGDMHQPLHSTVNHDGVISGNARLSGRKGPPATVHSRFESDLLKYLKDRLEPAVRQRLRAPRPVDPALLTAMSLAASREAYRHVDAVLAADREVLARHAGVRPMPWRQYYEEVEARMTPIAVLQIARAVQLVADVILTAHREATAGPGAVPATPAPQAAAPPPAAAPSAAAAESPPAGP